MPPELGLDLTNLQSETEGSTTSISKRSAKDQEISRKTYRNERMRFGSVEILLRSLSSETVFFPGDRLASQNGARSTSLRPVEAVPFH